MFSRFSTPFRTNLHCLMACLGPELTPVVSHLHLNQRPAKENHDLLTRGQWRSLANKSAGFVLSLAIAMRAPEQHFDQGTTCKIGPMLKLPRDHDTRILR